MSGNGNGRVGEILERTLAGERLTDEDAIALLQTRDLVRVGRAADELRNRKVDPKRVTFIIDRNLNYTNICHTDCDFCAFYRRPGDRKEGYLLPKPVIFKKIEETLSIGGTALLMQGGHHPDLGVEFYEDLFSSIKERYRDSPARALASRDPAHRAALEADDPRDADPPARRRPGLAAGRRRRDPRRPGPRHHRAQEDEVGRVARRHARCAPPGRLVDGDDDVRARRDARGARRAHAPYPRAPGRDAAASAPSSPGRSSRAARGSPSTSRTTRRRSTTSSRRRSAASTSTTSTTSSPAG